MQILKLLFLMLLCVETALPIGGTIVISEQDGGFVVQTDGPRIHMQEAWQVFEVDNSVIITPAQVQFPLAQALAGEIQVGNSDTSLTVTF